MAQDKIRLTQLRFLPTLPMLQVRQNKAEIDFSSISQAMDKIKLGLRHQSLPDSPAKRQYATVEAARWVAAGS